MVSADVGPSLPSHWSGWPNAAKCLSIVGKLCQKLVNSDHVLDKVRQPLARFGSHPRLGQRRPELSVSRIRRIWAESRLLVQLFDNVWTIFPQPLVGCGAGIAEVIFGARGKPLVGCLPVTLFCLPKSGL